MLIGMKAYESPRENVVLLRVMLELTDKRDEPVLLPQLWDVVISCTTLKLSVSWGVWTRCR